jgi:toxin ParE2
MNVRLLAPAQFELDEAVEWHAQQAPGCRMNRFPYSVIYALENDELVVLAIAHQHRKPFYWRDRQP